MVLNGKQKAAMLLMSLDGETAAELLKGIDPQIVEELAVEAAYLDVSGMRNNSQIDEITRQFYLSLENSKGFHINDFLNSMLKSTVGQEKAKRIQVQIQDLLEKRDPFIPIRQASAKVLASVLCKEHPQAIAVVLAELPSKKSSEVLGLLAESTRVDVVTRMTIGESINPAAKIRIAQLVRSQLETMSETATEQGPDTNLRKVAIMLRNLSKEVRDGLMGGITQKDGDAGKAISELMIIWDDIPEVTDRSLQGALREADARKLAMALIGASDTIASKIKANISERAAAAIDEETALMSETKKADIEAARKEIVDVLRQMNAKGDLNFIEK